MSQFPLAFGLAFIAGAAVAATARADDRSAFDGYRPFGEQPVAPWRQANDTVRDVGGWRAYAREAQAQAPAPAPVPASPASSAAPAASAAPAPSSAASSPHAGHH